jgi:hypothetical protein
VKRKKKIIVKKYKHTLCITILFIQMLAVIIFTAISIVGLLIWAEGGLEGNITVSR